MTQPETNLSLGGVVFPAGSARGIKQTISQIDSGEMRRTVNGRMVDLTRVTHRLYASTISCDDFRTPSLAHLWRGSVVPVGCVAWLRVPGNGTAAVTLTRPLHGEIAGYAADGAKLVLIDYDPDTHEATFAGIPAVVQWQPLLTMMVTELSWDMAEWESTETWSITLEERGA